MPNTARRLHLISNARSGKGAGSALPNIADRVCAELGATWTHYQIVDPKDLDSQTDRAITAAHSEGGVIVAAGGDGTIRSVTQKITDHKIKNQKSDLVLAVIPCGTFNFFCRTHKIPEDPEQALRLALTGKVKAVRLGSVNGHIFLINASLGLYVKAIRDRETRTARFGRNRVVATLSTVMTLLEKHRLLEVELVEGDRRQKLRTPMIFIGNNALQLRDLSIELVACVKEDLLAVVTMKPLKTWGAIKAIYHGLASTIEKDKGIDNFCVDTLTIHTRQKKQTLALDGELFQMQSPLNVKSIPHGLNLVVPQPVTTV